jgi:predicted adenine nucleotide alpha hydrolase (AANH) superfamily ATPase
MDMRRYSVSVDELNACIDTVNGWVFELAEEYGVPYLYSDFKKRNGYKRSIELSREYGLYRQDYCGCVFSKREREIGGSAPDPR